MTAQGGNHPDNKKDGLIQVSIGSLLLATMPLGILAALSWWIGLVDISTSIMTGCLRTLLQLMLLGTVLRPIFEMGNPFVVVLYALFMVVLAAQESSSRTKYQFENQFGYILTSLIINVGWVGLLGFIGIIRPRPLWNPRYVIPIVGMLLGNSISAVSLSLNSITTALVERQAEIELYLSFGASRYEAVSRLVMNGIQTGATPSMNMMRVVGIISIPGMMTGQILGGSPALVAARYQMLIIYLIASCTLSVILMNAWVAVGVGFDEHQVLRTDRFTENKRLGVLSMIMLLLGRATDVSLLGNGGGNIFGFYKHESSAMKPTDVNHIVVPPKDVLEIRALKESCPSIPTEDEKLDVVGLGRSFIVHEETQTLQQVLFEDISFEVSPGDLLLVRGPSGVGKSTLLRTIAGLGPLEEGTVLYAGHPWEVHGGQQWRRNIRYVAQTKVDIPGTPRDFLNRITSFASWKESGSDASSSPENVLQSTLDYIVKWGMKADSLDKEWAMLSGGEAQRVIVAMAMASNPKILLLDEATSGLDLPTKFLLEESVKDFVHNHVGGVLWVSHDSQQAERMSLYANNEEREEALEQHSTHVST